MTLVSTERAVRGLGYISQWVGLQPYYYDIIQVPTSVTVGAASRIDWWANRDGGAQVNASGLFDSIRIRFLGGILKRIK